MAKKEPTYRGKKLEELKAMSMEELIEIMPSRIRRKLKRGLNSVEKKLLERVKEENKKSSEDGGYKQKTIRTHSRAMPVLPEMVGFTFSVYNGKEFVNFEVVTGMIGQYLGEFAMPRRPVKHSAPGVGATRSSMFVPVK